MKLIEYFPINLEVEEAILFLAEMGSLGSPLSITNEDPCWEHLYCFMLPGAASSEMRTQHMTKERIPPQTSFLFHEGDEELCLTSGGECQGILQQCYFLEGIRS